MTLSIVPPPSANVEPLPTRTSDDHTLPAFEGEPVDELRGKMTSTNGLDVGENAHRLDDAVRLLVTARIQRVDHIIDDRTGRLVRVETFKVVEAVEVPWTLSGALLLDEDGDL